MRMKKLAAILCVLGLCGTLYACQSKTPEEKPLAEAELYVFNAFMEKEPETAKFSLEGKLPAKEQESGAFSGYIVVEETDGTKHTYKDLEYCWAEEMLILHRGDPTDEKGEGILCGIDPENPEKIVLADRNWCEKSTTNEIIAFVDDTYTDAEARSISTVINQIPNVYKSQFVHREDALKSFIADHSNDLAFSGVDATVLRHRFVVTLEDNTLTEQTAIQIESIPGIAEVKRSLWAPESIHILGYKDNGEQMSQFLENCWNCLENKK